MVSPILQAPYSCYLCVKLNIFQVLISCCLTIWQEGWRLASFGFVGQGIGCFYAGSRWRADQVEVVYLEVLRSTWLHTLAWSSTPLGTPFIVSPPPLPAELVCFEFGGFGGYILLVKVSQTQ